MLGKFKETFSYFSGEGVLSQDWEGRASIGNSEATASSRGKIDEFYMADTALNQKEVTRLMDQCIFEKGGVFVYTILMGPEKMI